MKAARVALAAVVVALGSVWVGAPASAAPTTQVVQGDVLRLVSSADWERGEGMLPGETMDWDVTVSADAADPGTVRIGASAEGAAMLALDVRLCSDEWTADGCSAELTELRTDWAIPRDGVEVPLLEMADTEVAHLRLTVSLANDQPGRTDVRVHAHGAGESAAVEPGGGVAGAVDGGLATTGMTPVPPWALSAAVLLVGLGFGLSVRRRRGVDQRRAVRELGS